LRAIGARSIEWCKPEVAQRHSGYPIGGTSPFSTRCALDSEKSFLNACAVGCGLAAQRQRPVMNRLLRAS
jgi:hypothetical protein